MNTYEEPTRIRVLEEDWIHVKLRSVLNYGESAQMLGGDMIASLVAGPLEQPLTIPDGPLKHRAVWICLPREARAAVDKVRKANPDASWSRLLHAAVLKDKQENHLTA